jgi:hypothetical protein
MKTILIAVKGGVAYVVDETVPKGIAIEIIDFDNLEDLGDPTTPKFSGTARKYIEKTDKSLAAALASRSQRVS